MCVEMLKAILKLLVLLIFSFIYMIAMFFYAKQRENELCIMYSKKKNNMINFIKNIKNYKKINFKKKQKQFGDDKNLQQNAIAIEENQNIRRCDICGGFDGVEYFPTDGYIEKNGNKTFLSGGVKLCRKCLESCKTCKICNKLIPTKEIEKYINDLMQHPKFCSHIFAHNKIAKIKEKYNIDNS